jgi:8-oxo-dGTP diphosphatase
VSSVEPLEVAAGLIFQGGRLLVCQRREEGSFPFKWELPGGKVEEGEGCLAALQRELKEELGIEVQSAKEVFRHNHLYPDGTAVRLTFFRVDRYRGEPANLAFQQILWAEIQGLGKLDFLTGDLPLIDQVMRGEL